VWREVLMRLAPEGKEFYFKDGTNARSLGQLVEKIKSMSPEEFQHHVNADKNDFHNWLTNCVSEDAASLIFGDVEHRRIVEKLTGHHWMHNHKKKFQY
jgi:hypothetical protein